MPAQQLAGKPPAIDQLILDTQLVPEQRLLFGCSYHSPAKLAVPGPYEFAAHALKTRLPRHGNFPLATPIFSTEA
jgi:hypothetical protein